MMELKDFIKDVLKDIDNSIEEVNFELCTMPTNDNRIIG